MTDPNIFITSKGNSIIINNVINLEGHHIIYLSHINNFEIHKQTITKVFFNQEEIQYKSHWDSPLKDITEKIIIKYKSIGWENYTITYNEDEYLKNVGGGRHCFSIPRQSVTIDFRK